MSSLHCDRLSSHVQSSLTSDSLANLTTVCVLSLFQAKQLEKKEAELKALDAFFKEQLAQLEKRVRDHSLKRNTQ